MKSKFIDFIGAPNSHRRFLQRIIMKRTSAAVFGSERPSNLGAPNAPDPIRYWGLKTQRPRISSIQDRLGTAIAAYIDVKRKARKGYFTSFSPPLLSIALLGLGLAGVLTIGSASPQWKIGRAVVEWRAPLAGQAQPGQTIPVLKLSLRNEGGAGTLPVQIFGRWAAPSAPPQSFTLLGSYQQQVALTLTAIVEAPLTPLKGAPAGRLALEAVVMTGERETDRKMLPWK
ncbi:MAG: hypothetical protein HW419_153 [Deltaproteobacteria bacterium]|nr:hypothetical protein [Deltaproteobacteria bacterium]